MDQEKLKIKIDRYGDLELEALTRSLGSISRQYNKVAKSNGAHVKGARAKLLVAGVNHGCIEVFLVPGLVATATAADILPVILDKSEMLEKFIERMRYLQKIFSNKPKNASGDITSSDCDDVKNIFSVTATRGSNIQFSILSHKTENNLYIDSQEGQKLVENALHMKAMLGIRTADTRENQALVLHQFGNDPVKAEGNSTKHTGIIADISDKPKPIFFDEEYMHLQQEMLKDKLFDKVYFVDIVVVHLPDGSPAAYKIVKYHFSQDKN